MPLTDKGSKIMRSMQKQYGARKGESVFYASRNKGTIKGVEGLTEARRRRGQLMRRFAESLQRRARESGSDELRGKNQDAQIRAMMAKDPEGAPTRKTRSYGKTKKGKVVGGHYS